MTELETRPVLSVCLITYNHAGFIEEALEGILRQQLQFRVEVVIGDDGSNDGTTQICKEYALKHPSIIRHHIRDRKSVIYKNGKPTGISNMLTTLSECKGKYIALLEGDDYWTYKLKLSEQVKILEDNSGISGVSHDCRVLADGDFLNVNEHSKQRKLSELKLKDVLASGSVTPTASLVFREEVIRDLPDWYSRNPSDWKIEILILLHGKLVNLDLCYWSIYRKHIGGIWSSENALNQLAFREEQARDLMSVDVLKDYHREIKKYRAHSYNVALDGVSFERGRKKIKLILLFKFIWFVEIPYFIKLKHAIKTIISILKSS